MPKPRRKEESESSEEFAGFSSDDEVNSDDFDEEFSGEDNDDILPNEPHDEKPDEKRKVSKHILQLREKLGLDELIQKKKEAKPVEKPKPEPNPSKPEPVVVVYNDPSKRKKKRLENGGLKKRRTDDEEDYDEPMDLIKAKHEVKRFTMQEMKSKTKGKEEARIQLAVSLGAIAPKQKPVNYKVYKQQRTKELARAKRLKEADNIFASKIQSMVRKPKQKKQDKNKVTNFDADFGKLTKNTKKHKKSRK